MQVLDVGIAFAALLALCFFLNQKCKVHAGVAPLAAISITMLWFSAAGCAGLLVPMGWAFYGIVFVLGIAAAVDAVKKKKLDLLSPAFCVFLGLGAVFMVYLAVRQPVVSVWDELSFWGTAAKMTKLDNTLYTVSELSQIWEWTATQKPGMIVLGYFMQFFGSGFAAWKLYLAYDLLLFACFAAVIGIFEKAEWNVWVPLALAGFLCPWFFTVYQRETIVRPVYMDSYGDIPAGVLAGGAVACWLCLRAAKGKGIWTIPIILTASMYVKDNTLPIALMAFGIVALDCFFFGLPVESAQDGVAVRYGKRAAFCAGCIACMGAAYMMWSYHAAAAVQLRAQQGGMGTTSMALGAVLKNGVQFLIAPGTVSPEINQKYGEKFAQVSANMWGAFFGPSITMAGPCATILVLLVAMFAASVIFGEKKDRLRKILIALVTVAGFFAYYIVILFSYVFIFKDFQAQVLDSYNRYIYPYLLFAFLVALALLAQAAKDGRGKWKLAQLVPLCLAAVMLWRFTSLLMPQFTVMGYPEPYFEQMKTSEKNAQAVVDSVGKDARIFYVYQGDNGEHWFRQSYNLLPLITDPSGSVDEEKGWSGGMGGTFGLAELANGDLYYHAYTPEQLSSYLLENNCDYMYIEQCDDIFVQSYAQLFDDALESAKDQPALYQIQKNGELAWMTAVPMEGVE